MTPKGLKRWPVVLLLVLASPSLAVSADGPYPAETTKPKKKAKPRPRPSPTPTPVPTPAPEDAQIAVEEALPIFEPEPEPPPPPPPVVVVTVAREPVTYAILATAQGVVSGDTDMAVLPGFRLSAQGPFAGTSLELWANLELTGSPGTTVNLSQVATFKAAEFSASLGKRVGFIRRAGQDVRTYLFVEGGFATRLPRDPAALEKYPRRIVAGLRVEERTRGAWLSLAFGNDDIAGGDPWRQLCWRGEIPVYGDNDGLAAIVGGKATLTVFGDVARDVFIAYVGARWGG